MGYSKFNEFGSFNSYSIREYIEILKEAQKEYELSISDKESNEYNLGYSNKINRLDIIILSLETLDVNKRHYNTTSEDFSFKFGNIINILSYEDVELVNNSVEKVKDRLLYNIEQLNCKFEETRNFKIRKKINNSKELEKVILTFIEDLEHLREEEYWCEEFQFLGFVRNQNNGVNQFEVNTEDYKVFEYVKIIGKFIDIVMEGCHFDVSWTYGMSNNALIFWNYLEKLKKIILSGNLDDYEIEKHYLKKDITEKQNEFEEFKF